MISPRTLVANAIVGLIVLLVANVIGLGVQISILTLLICAVLGVPGAVLVVLLAVTNVAFVGTLLPSATAAVVESLGLLAGA